MICLPSLFGANPKECLYTDGKKFHKGHQVALCHHLMAAFKRTDEGLLTGEIADMGVFRG